MDGTARRLRLRRPGRVGQPLSATSVAAHAAAQVPWPDRTPRIGRVPAEAADDVGRIGGGVSAPDARWQSFPGRHRPAQSTRPRLPRENADIRDCGRARAAPGRKTVGSTNACLPAFNPASNRSARSGCSVVRLTTPAHQEELRIVAAMQFGVYGLHTDTYSTDRAGLSRSARRRESDIRDEKFLTRRRPAGWRRRWRRSGPAGVRSGTMRRAAMNEPVASLHLPMRRRTKAHRENGLTPLTSRDPWENSNARFVRTPIGSGFIAVFDPAADEIFSPVFGRRSAQAACVVRETVAATPLSRRAGHDEASVRRLRSSRVRPALKCASRPAASGSGRKLSSPHISSVGQVMRDHKAM